jgi:hypothetical protein
VLITEEQVDPKTTQGILRHATSEITIDIYTHARDEAKRKALGRKFESRWSGENTGRKSQVENLAGLKNGRPEWTRTIDLFRVKEAL